MNVSRHIKKFGHDDYFSPTPTARWTPCDHPAGSAEKVQALAERVRLGFPLWHPRDAGGCEVKNFDPRGRGKANG